MARWDELVNIHVRSKFYDLDGFRAGRCTLCEIERNDLLPIVGKRILHLQCHFGADSLSLSRYGAIVTGVDFSPKAIAEARKLKKQTGIEAEFFCSDVYDIPSTFFNSFDIVFCSYGALIWLHDINKWSEIVANCLVPGGYMYVVDEHPLALTLTGKGNTNSLKFTYPYLTKASISYSPTGTYADRSAKIENDRVFLWVHSISSIINSAIASGMEINYLKEYDYSVNEMFPEMEIDSTGNWRLKGSQSVPLMLSFKATKKR